MENHAQDFVHINIPAQAEHDPSIGEVDILGREPGEYMVSARARTHAGWEKRKRSAGSRGWNALYQGRPAPAEGGELKRHWWRRYPHHMRAVQRSDQTWHALGAGVVIMTIDCAFKDQESSDFVCFQIWASKGSRAWLLDQVCERLSFTETVSTLIALAAKWPQAKRRYIEDKANGPAVVSALRGKLGGIIEYTPVDSKLARVRSVSPFVEAGDVEIPEDASFTHAFVEQCAAFPNGANDDMVDCLSLALIKLLLDGLGNQFMDELLAEQNAQSPTDHVLRQCPRRPWSARQPRPRCRQPPDLPRQAPYRRFSP
jgi:predicted phage terminase large subunit-like protein